MDLNVHLDPVRYKSGWIDLAVQVAADSTVRQLVETSIREGDLKNVAANDMIVVDGGGRWIEDEASSMQELGIAAGSDMYLVKRVSTDYWYTTLNGSSLRVQVPGNVPFLYLKRLVRMELEVDDRSQIKVIFAGKICEDRRRLFEYGCQKESTLHVVIK